MIILDNIVVKENDNFGNMIIFFGKYFVGYFDILKFEYSDVWDFMYNEWLLNGNYKLCVFFFFEVYFNNLYNYF